MDRDEYDGMGGTQIIWSIAYAFSVPTRKHDYLMAHATLLLRIALSDHNRLTDFSGSNRLKQTSRSQTSPLLHTTKFHLGNIFHCLCIALAFVTSIQGARSQEAWLVSAVPNRHRA